FSKLQPPPTSPLFPYTTLFRSAARLFGFQNVNYESDPITGGLPWFQMNPTTYAAIGDPTFIPMQTEDHNHQIEGSLTKTRGAHRSEEHTSELQSRFDLVCRLLL